MNSVSLHAIKQCTKISSFSEKEIQKTIPFTVATHTHTQYLRIGKRWLQ
jgi:hypothetical protein